MTNQELITELSKRLDILPEEVSDILETTVEIFVKNLTKENSVNIQGFGFFDVKRKSQRISVNPISQQRYLTPPKISVAFKSGNTVKEILKKLTIDE